MHPRDLSISDYTYALPDERIAPVPAPNRDESRLLIYDRGHITTSVYREIDNYLPQGSLLIFNDTRVVEARLLFRKPTGGVIEIFCLQPDPRYPDVATALQQTKEVHWQCMIGGASKWKPGQVLQKEINTTDKNYTLEARYEAKGEDHFLINLSWTEEQLSFAEVLHDAGAIPLPPYIKRSADEGDSERYQTIYAKEEGSVAAPTAGLHFTETIFTRLSEKHIDTDYVTLHVGAGTFKPVKAAVMEDHTMHAEYIDVNRTLIERMVQQTASHPIIPVGTTSLRTLESLYWLGVMLIKGQQELSAHGILQLDQWYPYAHTKESLPSSKEALTALLKWMEKEQRSQLIASTRLLIAPGYQPKIAQALITNFHQPQSTLLLLVAALIGEDWREVYQFALDNDFRFLSYGDGSLLKW
ncbi:S-adenosylmethionine:tRNA ribosyltransferase-isomerase [Nostoc ellipsosporum NOK]|nr:S-adenosylmethionine:tRNA ribosyltransferase-isomerase [Nostoc ellipsosporum NOK]